MANHRIKKHFRIGIFSLISLSILGGLLFYVWQKVEVVRCGYQIQKLREEVERSENDNKNLRMRIAKLSSLERIEKIARGKMGMVNPKKKDIIIIHLPEESK